MGSVGDEAVVTVQVCAVRLTGAKLAVWVEAQQWWRDGTEVVRPTAAGDCSFS